METTVDSTSRATLERRPAIGLALSGLGAAFLLFDGVIKLVKLQPVIDSFERLGYPERVARSVGLLELCCLGLYLVPRTATLGAVLLTGFLGGAISTHLRVGDPWLSHTLFPLYVAAFVWGGLSLRDSRTHGLWATPNRRIP
jgi:DoxX-like family